MKLLRFLFAVSIFCQSLLFAGSYSGKCVGVGDGDTILVMKYGRPIKIRLEGIDCPELGQDFGAKAKRFTAGMVFRKILEVREYYQDEYGRTVARVYIDSKDLSLELVKTGLAWIFRKGSDPILDRAVDQARKQKLGLWSRPNPVPPWEYRRRHGRQWSQ